MFDFRFSGLKLKEESSAQKLLPKGQVITRIKQVAVEVALLYE